VHLALAVTGGAGLRAQRGGGLVDQQRLDAGDQADAGWLATGQ
jgi:2-methylcitrate dehydratase PrpD